MTRRLLSIIFADVLGHQGCLHFSAFLTSVMVILCLSLLSSLLLARKQEIIKMTEQLIEAINNGDFDAYT